MSRDQKGALKRDILLCSFFIFVGVVALVSINTAGGHGNVAGTQTLRFSTLPNVYGGLLVLFSIMILAGSARNLLQNRSAQAQKTQIDSDNRPVANRRTILMRTWGSAVLLIAYALLLEKVHFILLTTLFLVSLFLLFGQRSPLKVLGLALAGGIGFYLLFIVGLSLPI